MLLLNSKDTGTKSACEPIPGRYPTYLYKLGSWVYFKNHYDGNLLQCGVIRSKFLVCREKNLTWVVCVHVHVLGPEMSPLESIDRSQITHLPKRYHYHHWGKGKETHELISVANPHPFHLDPIKTFRNRHTTAHHELCSVLVQEWSRNSKFAYEKEEVNDSLWTE